MADPPLPDLRRVVCFVAVADTLSLRRAGERLAVDGKWVSAQVRSLEETLGIALLERHGASVILTPAGQRLRAAADDLLAAQTAVLAALAAGRRATAGRLAVGAPAATARSGLRAELIAELLSGTPDLVVDVTEHASSEVLVRVRRGAVDAGLVMSPFDRIGLRALPLRVAQHTLLMPRDHPLARRAEVAIDALDGQPVAAFDAARNPLMFDQFLGPLRDAGAELVVVAEFHPSAYAAAVHRDGLLAVDVDGTILAGALEHERAALTARPILGFEGIADTYLVARRQADHPAVELLWRAARTMALSGAGR